MLLNHNLAAFSLAKDLVPDCSPALEHHTNSKKNTLEECVKVTTDGTFVALRVRFALTIVSKPPSTYLYNFFLFTEHSELNGSPSSTTKSRRANKDQDSDSMMVDGEDNKSTSSSRSSSPIDSAYHDDHSPMSEPHSTSYYPFFKSQAPVITKMETPAIPIQAFPLAPAACASLASSSVIVGSPSFDLAQVNKFKMFCDFVLRNEGVTH